ncbi:DUF4238 domain-containing protein [Flavobacterium sp. WG21]|uniref:DUF4238 domain-containing protein n=1 Tax=Flavobacterium sp. WG21 TaxID=1229487 RepID=UPI00034B62AD|nr:DUF4238 domain-containing protein [Flavobacterium sp. WG21]
MKKEEPINQKQHKVSQVYLKQFGYKIDDEYWLSVYKMGNEKTENVLIRNFTTETNIFDLPIDDFEIKRHFENLSSEVESFYRTVISNLHNQKRLTPKDKDVLNHFVANLLCRTNPFRRFINDLLNDDETRNKLINEITMFSNDTEENKLVLDHFGKDFQLNLALGTLMNHLLNVFRNFKKVIIKDCDEKGWITTDSPIHLDNQEVYDWIIPVETEIYFPLSKDFCLFMYHPESEKKDNPLRQLKVDKINEIPFELFEKISMKIGRDFDEYLIFCNHYEPTKMGLNDATANSDLA